MADISQLTLELKRLNDNIESKTLPLSIPTNNNNVINNGNNNNNVSDQQPRDWRLPTGPTGPIGPIGPIGPSYNNPITETTLTIRTTGPTIFNVPNLDKKTVDMLFSKRADPITAKKFMNCGGISTGICTGILAYNLKSNGSDVVTFISSIGIIVSGIFTLGGTIALADYHDRARTYEQRLQILVEDELDKNDVNIFTKQDYLHPNIVATLLYLLINKSDTTRRNIILQIFNKRKLSSFNCDKNDILWSYLSYRNNKLVNFDALDEVFGNNKSTQELINDYLVIIGEK